MKDALAIISGVVILGLVGALGFSIGLHCGQSFGYIEAYTHSKTGQLEQTMKTKWTQEWIRLNCKEIKP